MAARIDRVGQTGESNTCGNMKIIKYVNAKNITVQFDTGTVVTTRYQEFKKGQVKDNLAKTICGVGYTGIGNYKCVENGKITKSYNLWKRMIERVYNPYNLNNSPSYVNVTICDDWMDYQQFAAWWNNNFYEIPNETMHLDKDILSGKINNKVYSPDCCSFVPSSINHLLSKSEGIRGNCLLGTSFDKHRNKYNAQLRVDGENIHLGAFTTEQEAFITYKTAKEKNIKRMANLYKDQIPDRVYKALYNYKVETTD